MSLQKGDKAPSFTLFSTDKKEVSLADYAQKNLIIHFFPQAFTGVCTEQLCTTRDAIAMYQNDKTDVLAISVDSVFSLGKFKELNNLNFQLLSDFNREVSPLYCGFYQKFAFGMKDVSKRAVYVIDKNGIVQYAETVEVPSDLPSFEAINATLASL